MDGCKSALWEAATVSTYWRDQIPDRSQDSFTDNYFPPNSNSLMGRNQDGDYIDKKVEKDKSFKIREDEIEWRRCSWLFGSKQVLFEDKIECSDIKQGNLGNCYFLSSLAALCQYPYLIRQIFRTKEITKDGYFELVLFIDGKWQIVFVDDYIPVKKTNQTLKFAKPNGNELWVIILEKAWAKVNGGYLNTISGRPTDPLKALTGFATEELSHDDHEILFQSLKSFEKAGHIICSSTRKDEDIKKKGLATGHAYSILGVQEISSSENNIRLVHLRNPWGYKEWNGDWSDNSVLWTSELKKKFHLVNSDDGEFYMSFIDFVKYFRRSYVCHVMYDCNIKNFEIDNNSVHKPHVYNLLMNHKESKVSISILSKHWRYNRELRGKSHPFTIVIAEYQLNSKKLVGIAGAFSAEDNTEYVKYLKKGLYAVWIYCAYNHSQPPKPDQYQIRFSSAYKYLVRFENYDERFEFIREMVLACSKEIMLKSKSDKLNISNLNGTGLGLYCIYNNSDKHLLHEVSVDILNMALLPPYEDSKFFDLNVPARGFSLFLAIRTRDTCNFKFNCTSNETQIDDLDNLNFDTFHISNFVSTKVAQDENEDEDNYYNYYSVSLKNAKEEDD